MLLTLLTVCKLLLQSGKPGVSQQLPARAVVVTVALCVCACGGVMGRTLWAMLITHKCPRPVVSAALLMSYHTLWYPAHGCIPAIMASSWTQVSGRTADAGLKLGRGLRRTPWPLPSSTCLHTPCIMSRPGIRLHSVLFQLATLTAC